MKRKLTFLLFGLLLAVGWTNDAFAQSYVLKASEMNTNGEWWTYKWKNAAGDSIESPYVVLNPETNKYEAPMVTDPYQIYGLLRKVYMDTRLPGPLYSAWDAQGNREDPVFYGGMGGGWNIGATYGALGNITIRATQLSGSYPVFIKSVTIKSGSTVISTLENSTGSGQGWTYTGTLNVSNANEFYFSSTGGTFTFSSANLTGYTNVDVIINARSYDTDYSDYTLTVNGSAQNLNSTSLKDYNWSISAPASYLPDGTFTPKHEGYTALIVSLVNDTTKIHDESNDPHDGAWEFKSDAEAINYIKDNFQYVKLLTDGLRIGSGDSVGTVFNCSGTYNRFFFLGKGQARKKAPRMIERINNASTWGIDGEIYCEEGPFKYMFEEFSPTTGDQGSDITDFYMEMMDGAVYPVVHDCASVIQNKHQFSMSGKKGTQAYAMTGMNFFIPDYRLKFWTDQHTYSSSYVNYPYTRTVDGRDMNAYESVDANGNRTVLFGNYTNAVFSHWSVYWAQYNPDYAPLVGLYTLSLDANAQPCEGYQNPGNTNYTVTLDWTSSLNEMSGDTVPQMYIIYEVVTDSLGAENLEVVDTVYDKTTYNFGGKLWPQGAHSETHTYIIMGSPTDNDHPSFIAWSNQDDIIIPGLNDFLMLNLDHYESDFDVPNVQNWYRNFMTVNNDSYRGLTTRGIFEGDSVFNLLRYENLDSMTTMQVAKLKFANQADGRVKYTIKYIDENGENTQQIEPATDKANYQRSAMGIVDEGYLNIKTDRDIIIKPNGYGISFNQITLKVNGTTKGTWSASNGTSWPSGWTVQGKWTKDEGDDYYYMDGNGIGYILISGTAVGANATNVQVVINTFGDPGKTAKIDVNGTSKALLNGEENLRDYTWDVQFNNAKLNAPSRATTTTIDFSAQGFADNTALDGTTINSGSVSVTFATNAGNNGPKWFDNGNAIRIYQKNSMTVSSSSNNITGIKLNFGSGDGSATFSTNVGTWSTPNWTGDANSVIFTVGNSGTNRRLTSIEVTLADGQGGGDDPTPTEQTITEWNMGSALTSGWVLTPGSTDGSSGQGNGTNNDGSIWINDPGYITIPASFFDNYTDIRVEVSYAMYNTSHTGGYVSVNGVNGSASSSTSYNTYTWTDVDASNGIVIAPNTGWLNIGTIKVYGTPKGEQPPTPPTVEGLVRISNLPIVDQFAKQIPAANNHPYRYSYFLQLANGDSTSNTVRVPVQHTGAKMQGYYTHAEMKGDTVPTNFLTENVISAQVDMTLSPTSAPYYYTINSKKGGVPADAWSNYMSVLQREDNGMYKEMQTKSMGIDNPYLNNEYDPGEFNMLDYRQLTSATTDTLASYVPIVWTKGIDRHYYTADTLHNSYGAPIWEVRRGDVIVNKDGTVCQKQARKDANGNWAWNNSVNYTLDGTDYCLYFVSVDALGILPVGNVEYEPYMFRLWLVDSTASMRNYTWELNDKGKPVKIVDAGPYTENGGMWKLLDTKMCENWDGQNFDPDLDYVVSIVDGNAENHSWSENIAFVGPMNNYTPKLYVRFYYKIKGAVDNTIGMRGINDDDNVGYVVVRGHNPDPGTAVHEIVITGEVESQTFYNVQGMQSDKPFDGINIVVTRYSNGATTTTKVRY